MMCPTRQLWFLQRKSHALEWIIPAVTGCSMFCASMLPWLRDPLGRIYSAWELPVDIGWQFRLSFLNYGLLCLCSAFYAWVVAWTNWKPLRRHDIFTRRHVTTGLCCMVPVLLFFLQYLCADIQAIELLAQHKVQVLLAQRYFGYRVTAQLIPLDPLALDISTIEGRLQLLLNQLSPGLLLPCVSAWIAIDSQRLFKLLPQPVTFKKCHNLLWLVAVFCLMIVFGRAPSSMLCEYQARTALSSGSYSTALKWLYIAHFLNPALEHVAYTHRERGQALYFLSPTRLNDDSRVYLAYMYREQKDYLAAYQQLLLVWRANSTVAWAREEMSTTLMRRVEATRPLKNYYTYRLNHDEDVLSWLQMLAKVDPNNIYSHYVAGRVYYDMQNYVACAQHMSRLLHLTTDADMSSAAYTYMALSKAGLGDHANARLLLFKAVELDPGYRNNTAREELSGLR